MHDLIADLVSEQDSLDAAIVGIGTDIWDAPSPAEGWTLRDSIAHLAEIDEVAAFVTRERRWPLESLRVPGAVSRPPGAEHTAAQLWARGLPPADVLAWWRAARQQLAEALAPLDPKERLPWAGPPMSARSFASARLMEAWSHGLDVLATAGREKPDTDRLRHIAHIGYVTREFSYRNRGLEPPAEPLFLKLVAPSGAVWTWGPTDAAERISGTAGDFCRVVTQRIHPADTRLRAEGEHATEFLRLAQAFAGPPGAGRSQKSATEQAIAGQIVKIQLFAD
ncbi:MAG: TIGR03084 family metal-binding protein [Dehalococcoidia bacterium]